MEILFERLFKILGHHIFANHTRQRVFATWKSIVFHWSLLNLSKLHFQTYIFNLKFLG